MGLTRMEFWSRLGAIKIVDAMTDFAYEMTEKDIWLNDKGNSPHGEPWHTSFHASSFPGDDPYACGRAAQYTMMNLPSPEPTSRWLRMLGDSGKAIEHEVVSRWGQVGGLLSEDTMKSGELQTGFVDPDYWLTGNCDAITIPHGWNRGHVVEVKSKALKVVQEMRMGQRGPDDKHVNQVKTYIGLAHETFHLRNPILKMCQDTWAVALKIPQPDGSHNWACPFHGENASCLFDLEMQPVRDGTIYYLARDDPSITYEFFYGLDKRFIDIGRERLAEWRTAFRNGDLIPRPDDWMWSKAPYPCRYCPFKKHACKPDDKDHVSRLEDSHGIEYARSIRPNYDYDETHKAVIDRWEKEIRT